MVKRNFYLNDILVEPPVNNEELGIKFNFEKDAYDVNGRPKLTLSITDFEWGRENNDTILKHYNDGKSLRGLPLKYELDRDGDVERIFDGYIDFTDNARLGRLTSTTTAKQRQNIDWLNDVADKISYEHLASIGVFSPNDADFMPYILNKVPDYQEAAIAILSSFYLKDKLQDCITKLTDLATDTANPLTAPNSIIKAVFYVLYLIILIVSVLLLIKKIILYLIQPVKFHACMSVKKIMEKTATYFGFTFKSDIFDKAPFNKLVFMPEKFYNPFHKSNILLDGINGTFGYTSPDKILQRGYPTGTPGDFLRSIKKVLRAKIVINDSKQLYFVPEWYNSGINQYQLPDLQQDPNYEFTLNLSELKANYVLSFQVDTEDKNTTQEYKGTSLQVITKFKTAVPTDLNLLKGIEDNTFDFALIKTKTSLSVPEEIIKDMLDAISFLLNGLIKAANALISVVNDIISVIKKIIKILKKIGINIKFDPQTIPKIKPVDLGSLIENRIGMAKIETDLFTIPKLFLMAKGSEAKFNKIPTNNGTIVSAKYLYDNYHKASTSFLPSPGRPNGNQYVIKNFDKVPFVFSDFLKVKADNNIFTSDNKKALIDDGEWNDFNETAKLKVRISQTYIPSSEIEEVYLEPDGR